MLFLSLLTYFTDKILDFEVTTDLSNVTYSSVSSITNNIVHYRPGNRRPPNIPEVAHTPKIEWSSNNNS